MRSLLLAGVLAVMACEQVVPVGTERLPPPEVEIVDEGSFSTAVDPCGVLAVSPPVRLSGTPSDSRSPAIAVLGGDGPAARVLVMWVEDDGSAVPVHARMLLADGSFYGPLARVAAQAPTSIAIAPFDTLGSFSVALADAGDIHLIPLVQDSLYRPYEGEEPVEITEEWETQRRWILPGVTAPRAAVLADRALVAALGPDEDQDGEGDTIEIIDVALDPTLPPPCRNTSRVPAAAVDIVADGDGAEIVWVHDGELRATRLTPGGCACLSPPTCDEDWWQVPADTEPAIRDEGIVGTRIRSVQMRGDLLVAVPRAGEGAIWLWEGGDEWATIRSNRIDPRGNESFVLEPWEEPSFAIAVEPGRRRLALARPVAPAEDAPAEIEIERGLFERFDECVDPLSCVQLSADVRDSHEPEMVSFGDGFGVVWSDEEADGQREVYYAKVTCAALPRR